MAQILVIDASSLFNFNKYYYFDRKNESVVYDKLLTFFIRKIKAGEIIILDIVEKEVHENKYTHEFKAILSKLTQPSLFLEEEVEKLIMKYTREDIIRKFNYNETEVEKLVEKYKSKHADLYLVAYCLYLKSKGNEPMLINEETKGEDDKIIHKIPTICNKENIKYKKLPEMLFQIYKDELEFDLNTN